MEAELSLTRGRATSWAKGVGALLVAGLAFTLVKGRSELTDLAPECAGLVGALLLAAVGSAVVAAYYLFSAAYGRLGADPPGITDHALAVRTMNDTRIGLRWAIAGAVALLGAVAVTWYGPAAEGPRLEVVDGTGASWCGEPTRTSNGVLTLSVSGQEVQVNLTTAARVSPVVSCPKS